MASSTDPSVPREPPAAWQVEPPRPADRGLVGRLLEDVVAEDPSVAPEVAAGSVRAGAWLHRERPAWSGVVVDPAQPTRTVVGYADVLVSPEGGHEPRHLLVHPAYRDRDVVAVLVAASGAAAAELDAAAASGAVPVDELLPDPDETTYEPARVSRSRWRGAALGAGAIAVAGVAAVLAVQVGAGPLGSVLPFLAPRDDGSSSSPPSSPTTPSPSPTTAPGPQPVVVAGDPLTPVPDSTTSSDPGPVTPPPTPDGSPTPTTPPTPSPTRSPGLASLLLDPVVGGLVDTVDGLTGDALSPVTEVLDDTTDATTDVLDGVLDGVLGLLPAPSATTGSAPRR